MMIIIEDSPKTPLNNGAGHPGYPSAPGGSSMPPPSYGASVSPRPYPESSQPYPVQYHIIHQPILYRQSPSRRFCRAFFFAILVWFLFSILVQSIVSMARWSQNHGRYNTQGIWAGDFPVPPKAHLEHCISGDDWSSKLFKTNASQALPPLRYPYSAETSFDLPLSADNLFLLARGPQTYGVVHVKTSPTPGNVAKVHITVRYYEPDVLDSGSKACLVRRDGNQHGVGIFSRRWIGGDATRHSLYFETTIVFPESGNPNHPRRIKRFETDVPNSGHNVGDLQGLVEFDNISLKASNGVIHALSMYANQGELQTSNGAIHGTFNTSTSLILKTSNSPIEADVNLTNDDKRATRLVMRTSNGKIESHVHLFSPSDAGGKYSVAATTSNSPVTVNFPTSPIDSTLDLSASTSNSPASISLHPAYEGSFYVATSLFSPTLKQRDVKDPSGKGRKRTVEHTSINRGALKGSISWSKEKGPGSVFVKTSNSPATLEI